MAFPNYTIGTDTPASVSVPDLDAELVAAGPYDTNFLGVSVTGAALVVEFDAAPSAANITTVEGVLTAHDKALELAQTQKNKAINANTRVLIEKGFEYPASSGTFYSLSNRAQMSINTTNGNRSDLTFPVNWDSKDDMSDTSFDNAADFHAFGVASAEAIISHRESGRALKATVRSATTVAEVDAVVDTRT